MPAEVVNATSDVQYKEGVKELWTACGVDTQKKVGVFRAFGETPDELCSEHSVLLHADGKHSIFISVKPSNWYPRSDAWVFLDRLVVPEEVKMTKPWTHSVPAGWSFHLNHVTPSVDEQNHMAMGQKHVDTLTMEGGEVKLHHRHSWHYEEGNSSSWMTGDEAAAKSLAQEISSRLFGDESSVRLENLFDPALWPGSSDAMKKQEEWRRELAMTLPQEE